MAMNWKYTDATEKVAYRESEDGSVESHSVDSLVLQGFMIDGGKIDNHTPPPPDYVSEALEALVKSDTTFLRCLEKGKVFPQEWVDYRAALRPIARGTALGPLPKEPVYP
jgi:hypothetical protein